MESAIPLFTAFFFQTPVYALWLAGIVLSLLFWRRHPRTSVFALAAFTILLLTGIVSQFLTTWLPMDARATGGPVVRVAIAITIISVVHTLLDAVAFGLILAAIFSGRKQEQMEGVI